MKLEQLWSSGKDSDKIIVVEMKTSIREDSHFRGLGDLFAKETLTNKRYHNLSLYNEKKSINIINRNPSNQVFVIFSLWEFISMCSVNEKAILNWKYIIQNLAKNNRIIIFAEPTIDENGLELSNFEIGSEHNEIKKLRYLADQYWIAIGEGNKDVFYFQRTHYTNKKFFNKDYVTIQNIDGEKIFSYSKDHPLGLDNKVKVDEKGMNPVKPKDDLRFDQNQGTNDEKSLPFLAQQNNSGCLIEMGSNTVVKAGGRIIFQEDEYMDDEDDDLDI
uniref:Elongator complex protein 5 n=1 Tax=Parastrongyloides trichosuri TaxID=131310 RepID=A0A0N4ZIF7_PARTI